LGLFVSKINGDYIKAHVLGLYLFVFEINKRCSQQLLLLMVCYCFCWKALILTASGFDLHKAKHFFSILSNYSDLALPAAKILVQNFILVLFKKLAS